MVHSAGEQAFKDSYRSPVVHIYSAGSWVAHELSMGIYIYIYMFTTAVADQLHLLSTGRPYFTNGSRMDHSWVHRGGPWASHAFTVLDHVHPIGLYRRLMGHYCIGYMLFKHYPLKIR